MYFEYIHSEIIDDRIDAQFFTPEYIKSLKKINQFRIETLGNISRRIFDPPHTAPEFVDKSDFEMIMIENITLNGIEGNFRAISETCHKDIFKNSHLEGNELLVSRVGNSSGTFASVFPCYKGKNVSGNISIIKLKDEIIDKEYAFAYFNSNIGQNSIKRNIANTARKFLTISKIREFQVPIPSPEIQKYIGDKVRKAEELREEAKRLKKEAEEIFYEAIEIDKLNSKLIKVTKFSWIKENQIEDRLDLKYNSPSIITIYEHFRKYKCSLLKDEFKTISGYAFSSGDFDDMDGEKVIKIGDISDFTIDTTSLTRVKIGTKVKERIREFSCNIQDLVYAMTGATIGKVAMYIDNETVYINQRVACIKPKRNNIPTGYLLLYLNSDIGKEISYSLSTGVAQPNIALEELNNIVIPQLANNIMDKIHHNVLNSLIKHKESKQLIQEAKRDVEDLIEGNFDMSKVKANS